MYVILDLDIIISNSAVLSMISKAIIQILLDFYQKHFSRLNQQSQQQMKKIDIFVVHITAMRGGGYIYITDLNLIKLKNLVVAHSLGGRVGMEGGYWGRSREEGDNVWLWLEGSYGGRRERVVMAEG